MAKGKQPKLPHVVLYLPTDDEGLFTRCSASWAAIKADPARFATPYPPVSEVDNDLATLGSALQKAAGKDPVARAALRVAATKVRSTYGMVGKYVERVVRAGPIEDAAAIISSVLMYESNVGKRAPKPELQAKYGALSGGVDLIALAVARAMAYHWESSADQVSWTEGAKTAQARAGIAGFTAGKTYYFRFRTFQRDGTMTGYSQTVSLMVR